jgi:hypothetical protein
MRAGSKRWLGLCCAIALVSIAACRQVVGFDKPPRETHDASTAESPKPLPLLPFVPEPEYAETCTSCATQMCSAQHQACVDNTQCKEMLRCYGGDACSDPLCIARCGSYDLLDYAWRSGGPVQGRRGAEVALFSAYQACVSVDNCPTDCGWGLDWGCLDKSPRYRWPPGLGVNLKLELLFPEGGLVSARVSAYATGTATGMGFVNQLPRETGGWGQVELEFPPGNFDGFLQIESDAGALYEVRMLDYSGPFFRDTRLSRNVFPVDLRPPSPHAGFAGVIIAATDCIGAPASGITFELEGASGQVYSYAPENPPWSVWVLGANSDVSGVGGFADVSPANTTVTVLAKRGEQTVARRTVYLRENWLTSVILRPLSGDD